MEENKNQAITQTNTGATTDSTKKDKNIFMLLVLLGLVAIFVVLIYAISMNNEADYMSAVKPANLLNLPKRVGIPAPPVEVEGIDSINVGEIDKDIEDLNIDLQGL